MDVGESSYFSTNTIVDILHVEEDYWKKLNNHELFVNIFSNIRNLQRHEMENLTEFIKLKKVIQFLDFQLSLE